VRGDERAYLFPQLSVKLLVLVWPQLLLDEGEEDGDDDACFERFSEDDEKDGDGEDLHHDGGDVQCFQERMKMSRPGRSISLLKSFPRVYKLYMAVRPREMRWRRRI
jgi:hypothetical protein